MYSEKVISFLKHPPQRSQAEKKKWFAECLPLMSVLQLWENVHSPQIFSLLQKTIGLSSSLVSLDLASSIIIPDFLRMEKEPRAEKWRYSWVSHWGASEVQTLLLSGATAFTFLFFLLAFTLWLSSGSASVIAALFSPNPSQRTSTNHLKGWHPAIEKQR